MRLCRVGAPGLEHVAIVDDDDTLRDASVLVPIGARSCPLAALPYLAGIDTHALPALSPGVRLGPCVRRPGTFVGIGLNFRDHALEVGLEVPVEPAVFLKATTSVAGPHDDVQLAPGASKLDYEVELVVVIGRRCRRISRSQAAEHIAGYCVGIDFSDRAFQLERGGQWTKGKSYDTYGPLGPYFVTPDSVGDLESLRLWLDVDGERRQNGSTRDMIWDVASLVAYVSEFLTLEPGDVVTTGTPAGVGHSRRPPEYLSVGSVVECGIEGLGSQRHVVIAPT